MHGDFSLNPLEHQANVVRILSQQGRVSLDSDFNAAQNAQIRYLRALAIDVIGPHGGNGFKLDRLPNDVDLTIGPGHYWVDGLLAMNGDPLPPAIPGQAVLGTSPWSVKKQPSYQWPASTPSNAPLLEKTSGALLFLDVWERHLSSAEDDSIREVALGGPDSASRGVIVWQVRMLSGLGQSQTGSTNTTNKPLWYSFLRRYFATTVTLRARTDKNQNPDPCALPPDSRYRGRENQLYRVEIHTGSPEPAVDFTIAPGGSPLQPPGSPTNSAPQIGTPTFKWSRDNGSNVLRVRRVRGNVIDVESLGYDERTGLSVGDWVELVDDRSILMNDVQPILQVRKVDHASLEVTLSDPPPRQQGNQQILRRWHGKDTLITEGSANTGWLHLEDGISVQFAHGSPSTGNHLYRTGDHWFVPARVATGDIIWPGGTNPAALPPHGVSHHYAPLAVWDGAQFEDARMLITPITHIAP